jgi:glycosyltransferase involved in cell wall biosynthesis
VERQVASLRAAGLRCDVIFVRGYVSPLSYVVAAYVLFRASRNSRFGYRIVHGHGGETLLPLLFVRRSATVISFCGDDLLGSPGLDGSVPLKSRIRRRVLAGLARFVDATITKSAVMEEALPPTVRGRNHVLPNGVDRGLFSAIDRDAARARLGWPHGEPIALFAADPAVPRKRYWLAEAACGEARRLGAPVRLEVATRLDPSLMPLAMSAADLLVITSAVEGSPNVVKEAMMCGLPVVSTVVGDVPELLRDVEPSWVCQARAAELGRAIAECVRTRKRSNGRSAGAWLDEGAIALRLLATYAALTDGCPADLAENRCAPLESYVRPPNETMALGPSPSAAIRVARRAVDAAFRE